MNSSIKQILENQDFDVNQAMNKPNENYTSLSNEKHNI